MKEFFIKFYRYIFARKYFRKWNRGLMSLALRGLGVLNADNHKLSGEKYFLETISNQLEKPLIIDVGANAGDYTRLAQQTFENPTIHSFEPHPESYSKLVQNVNDTIHTHQKAVGNTIGEKPLFNAKSDPQHRFSSLHSEPLREFYDSDLVKINVPVITLDNFLDERQIDEVDLLKIDTEGHEYDVLQGAERAIKSGKIRTIQFEFNAMNVSSRVFFRDFIELLEEYEIYRMLPRGVLPLRDYRPRDWELFAYQNIIATTKDLPL